MAKEIERKFLVNGDAWKSLAQGTSYRQGYLNSVKERTVRVRTIDDKGYLTVKGITTGATRSEYEYEIPAADADAMLTDLCEKPLIEKNRYKIRAGEHTWEIDEFFGENQWACGGRGRTRQRGPGLRKTRMDRRRGDGRSPLLQLESDQTSLHKVVSGPK